MSTFGLQDFFDWLSPGQSEDQDKSACLIEFPQKTKLYLVCHLAFLRIVGDASVNTAWVCIQEKGFLVQLWLS